jgi:hypothetical protein
MSTGIDFSKQVNIYETAHINKVVDVHAFIHGNTAMANATADALGTNTVSETLTETHALQGVGSAAASESLSATSGFHYMIW